MTLFYRSFIKYEKIDILIFNLSYNNLLWSMDTNCSQEYQQILEFVGTLVEIKEILLENFYFVFDQQFHYRVNKVENSDFPIFSVVKFERAKENIWVGFSLNHTKVPYFRTINDKILKIEELKFMFFVCKGNREMRFEYSIFLYYNKNKQIKFKHKISIYYDEDENDGIITFDSFDIFVKMFNIELRDVTLNCTINFENDSNHCIIPLLAKHVDFVILERKLLIQRDYMSYIWSRFKPFSKYTKK